MACLNGTAGYRLPIRNIRRRLNRQLTGDRLESVETDQREGNSEGRLQLRALLGREVLVEQAQMGLELRLRRLGQT